MLSSAIQQNPVSDEVRCTFRCHTACVCLTILSMIRIAWQSDHYVTLDSSIYMVKYSTICSLSSVSIGNNILPKGIMELQ